MYKSALLILVAGIYLCSAAPAVEHEEPRESLYSFEAIPAIPTLALFHIHKPHLKHLIPHKISGTIHKGAVTIHGSIKIGH